MSETTATGPRRPGAVARIVAGLRQRSFPAEFRIDPPHWPRDLEASLRRIAELRAAADADHPAPDVDGPAVRTGPEAPPPPTVDDDALADAALGLWRTQRRLDAAGDDRGALARQLRRHLSTAWDGLAELGITVRTHDQEPFDSGMSVEVLAFEPRTGLTRETIIETVRPTFLRSGRQIRMGQVIVGRPERSTDS